jgi:transposase
MEKYFDKEIYRFGTAKLVKKGKKYFLHIPVTRNVTECNLPEVSNVVGIDRGINFTEKGNRNKKQHLFECKKCGYRSNDDRIGAMNLYQKGISFLKGTVTSE